MPEQRCELEKHTKLYVYCPKATFREHNEEGTLLLSLFLLVIGGLTAILAARLHVIQF
jgi:hypothetical protein